MKRIRSRVFIGVAALSPCLPACDPDKVQGAGPDAPIQNTFSCPGDVNDDASANGGEVFVASPMEITATFMGGNAGYSGELFLHSPGEVFIGQNHVTPSGTSVVLGSFGKGQMLVFRLYIPDTGDTWYSGPATDNSDGEFHARIVQANSGLWYGGFEDMANIGDSDFEDVCFTISGDLSLDEPED
jgi:hypothetical protein